VQNFSLKQFFHKVLQHLTRQLKDKGVFIFPYIPTIRTQSFTFTTIIIINLCYK